jgi:hypothetical protein
MRRAAWYHQQVAVQAVITATSIVGMHAVNTVLGSAATSREMDSSMEYKSQVVEVGEVNLREPLAEHGVHTTVIPGRFGTALGLVATISAHGHRGYVSRHDPSVEISRYLWCWFATGVDGARWHPLSPPGENEYRLIHGDGFISARLTGPFGDHLAIHFAAKESNQLPNPFTEGLWSNVSVTLGVQRVG